MPRYTNKVATIAYNVIRHGLRMEPRLLTRREKMEILDDVQDLVDEGHASDHLVEAARFGMDHVWPFSEGQSWDSKDFRKNVTKAKSAAARLRRAGQLPTNAREVVGDDAESSDSHDSHEGSTDDAERERDRGGEAEEGGDNGE